MSLGTLVDRAIKAVAVGRVMAGALTISVAGIGGIVAHETMVPKVYFDPVGIPTVCAGHTATVTAADVGKKVDRATCERLLKADTEHAQDGVRKAIKVPITQHQFDALVSFTFNVGNSALAKSTLARKLNAGDECGAAAEFPRWNKARGRVLNGLTKRRLDEQATFLIGLNCPGLPHGK
jgi:lysozyme